MQNFTIIYDDEHCEFRTSVNKQTILGDLERSGSDYLEVIPGHHKVPHAAIEELRSNPMGFAMKMLKAEEAMKAKVDAAKNTIIDVPVNKDIDRQQLELPETSQKQLAPATVVNYFTDNETEFKTEDNKLFKRVWVEGDTDVTRIINVKSKKVYTGDQYAIESLQWREIK